MKPSSSIAVLYLARKAEGIAAFQRFIQSYRTYPAGVDHELIVIFKGFEEKELKNAWKEFSELRYTSIEVNDNGFDTGSYFKAAQLIAHEYICCMNTFSEICADNWLQKLLSHAQLPHVGIAGATGSYESTCDSITLIQKAIWLNSQQHISKALRESINQYFAFILQPKAPHFLPTAYRSLRTVYRYLRSLFFRLKYNNDLEKGYAAWWSEAKKLGDIANFCSFPPFPNPHIRSNAFMIRRERFLEITHEEFVTKLDACRFESGHHGMTQQIIKKGLEAVIVGKDGLGYAMDCWHKSDTFRSRDQHNLLVADNQTEFFKKASDETRLLHSWMTWGDDAVRLPRDFPNLGIKLPFKDA